MKKRIWAKTKTEVKIGNFLFLVKFNKHIFVL